MSDVKRTHHRIATLDGMKINCTDRHNKNKRKANQQTDYHREL